jgi:hypothetical protein
VRGVKRFRRDFNFGFLREPFGLLRIPRLCEHLVEAALLGCVLGGVAEYLEEVDCVLAVTPSRDFR